MKDESPAGTQGEAPENPAARAGPAAGQAAIDEAEWDDRRNWKLGLFYYSPRDSRAWVPKRSTFGRRRVGGTPNLAQPAARNYLKIMLGVFGLVVLLVVLLERCGFLR